ncbi:MAG: tyrosine-type recombinase/integrase [Caulobacteraceae bacterium]
MITDATIKSALNAAPTSGKTTIELKDEGPRGEGRLALIIRVAPGRITAEWYAVWYVGGKRAMAKMGAYPTVSLKDARRSFGADYAPAIARGEQPEAPKARKVRLGVTVKDLFETYVAHLRAANKGCADQVEYLLLTAGPKKKAGAGAVKPAVKSLGPTRRAADVTPQDIIPHLKGIYDRGSPSTAALSRAYICAAFAHAIDSQNSYTRNAGTVDWGIKANPVTAIPADVNARRAGERHLNQSELHDLWHWLVEQDARSVAAPAARLILACGQRVVEIMRVTDKVWSEDEKMFDWGKTKNGRPHNLPVPDQGVAIMGLLRHNKHGLYFPHRDDPTKPMEETVSQLIGRYLDDHPDVPHFSPRDFRRTWKTLAGAAGISKELRDRIQNHARSDVSSRHYDRYEMLPERRAAMEVWNAYLTRIIAGEFKNNTVKITAEAA